MARGDQFVEHLLRRAGFGASVSDLRATERYTSFGAIDRLVRYDALPDDVDDKVGQAEFVSVATRGVPFSPYTNIEDARQLWLFRMLHTERPLQEKMALFWHNHFATAYSKLNGLVGGVHGTKMMFLKPGALPGPMGQIETFRQHALGKFRDLLTMMARDPAMLVWLDGRTNTRQRPQENFAREILELFTIGLGQYTEQDVQAAARVFTGWNLRLVRGADDAQSYYEFVYNANQHDTGEKTFTFPIYRDGRRGIPARSAADGAQDGLDLVDALATHPETGRRLARKLWRFLISEVTPPDETFVAQAANIYLRADTAIGPLVEFVLRSSHFADPRHFYARYAWPVEFVIRAIKEVGWRGYSIDTARAALVNLGQQLFEPPDVNGWELGQGWFSTGAMLARMNFAAALAQNQRFNLGAAAASASTSPARVLTFFLDRLSPAPYDRAIDDLQAHLTAGITWNGSEAQLQTKSSGLVRLIVGSAHYQVI